MDNHHVVVTYKPGEAKRALIRELLGRDAKLSFLVDLPPGLRQQTLAGADVLLTFYPTRELGPSEYGLLENVKLLQLILAGADAVPFAALREDILIASNAGAYALPMAEHVLAMTLALTKNLLTRQRELEKGKFNQPALNRMLQGLQCGILGFGGIGKATASLMRGMGMRVHAINSSGRTDEPVDFIGTLRDLEAVLAASDVVVISLPLTKATRGLIGRRELGRMKPDAILINVARGDIIDEHALYAHLSGHPGFMAGIDAWWIEPFTSGEFRTNYPFLALPNVLGSPHNSTMVPGMSEEGLRRALENVKRFLKGEPVRGVVQREEYV
jgi:phosphoglycerate dehydrogenase-like enzyme